MSRRDKVCSTKIKMKLIVAGAGHGVPERHRFCTSLFLQVGENTYIFDAGAPVSALLERMDIPHKSVKGVFITHAHSDHLNGLPAFCSELMWWMGYIDCDPVFCYPEQKCIDAVNSWIDILEVPKLKKRQPLQNKVYSQGVIFDDGVIRVSALRNKHTAVAYSFKVEAEGKKIFLSGDLGYGFGEYLDLLGDETYDLVLCEGAHHTPGTVNDILAKTPTKRLVIHHINPEREPYLRNLEENTSFPCCLAEDGFEIEL